MNSALGMDQAEKVGLGAAVGGHALLLALLVFGLFQAARPQLGSDGGGSGDGIAVSIVSEGAASSPAPAPSEVTEEVVEQQAEILPEATFDLAPLPTPLPKTVSKPVQKSIPKTTPIPQPRSGTGRGGTSDFDKRMKDALGGGGGGTGASKTKGPGAGSGAGATTQSAGEIRSLASAAIASEVRPLIPGCAPSTSDNSSLRVFVQLNIGQSRNLVSATVYDVQGITPANEAQVDRMKKCVLDSLRAASPYNLEPEGFETWRNHKVQLKVNFK